MAGPTMHKEKFVLVTVVMGTFDRTTFTNSCLPIKYIECLPGTDLIDPCKCDSYYECNVGLNVIPQICAGGTLYDYTQQKCNTANEVELRGICNPLEPWFQCRNTTGANIPEIAKRCGGTAPTQAPPKSTTIGGTGGTGSNNTGVIVGAVIGVLLVVVIIAIVLLFLYFRKKKQKNQDSPNGNGFRASMNNPGYFTRDESIYAKVDDSMASPVYSSDTISSIPPKLPAGRPPSQQSSAGVSIQLNGRLDDGYVEPSETLKKTDDSKPLSNTWTESTYMEVVDGEKPTQVEEQSPYDNSFR